MIGDGFLDVAERSQTQEKRVFKRQEMYCEPALGSIDNCFLMLSVVSVALLLAPLGCFHTFLHEARFNRNQPFGSGWGAADHGSQRWGLMG